MLIPPYQVTEILSKNNIDVTGVFHIGAHECEELNFYNTSLNINSENVVWVDAIPDKVSEAANRGIPNVYCAVISDRDDEDIMFNIANNGQSSSILEFKTHSFEHPSVVFVDKLSSKTTRVDTFFKRNNLDASKYNFWNLDIQGVELLALKGAIESLKHVKVIYTEVNTNELYKDCALIGEIDEFLSTFGFKRVLTNMTPHGWGDAIYILS
jgi:FkbM family methyltransferase